MNQSIKDRFNTKHLQEAVSHYGASIDKFHMLGDFDSFVFEFEKGGRGRILRISHSSQRSAALVMAELDWINHLVRGGASVSPVLPSDSGHLLEEIDDDHGEKFIAVTFDKAEGYSPQSGQWSPDIIIRYGKLLGKIHRLSRVYTASNPAWRRLPWNDPIMFDVEVTLSDKKDRGVLEVLRKLLPQLEALPKEESSYGLIHQDAHGENLKVDASGQITLFDCFDCVYSWFVNDLAIVLFYAAMWEKDKVSFTERFMSHFLAGYTRENELENTWLQQIPKFLKLREIDLYAVIMREFGDNWQADAWNARYMHERREKIEAGVPYIDYDFSRLA